VLKFQQRSGFILPTSDPHHQAGSTTASSQITVKKFSVDSHLCENRPDHQEKAQPDIKMMTRTVSCGEGDKRTKNGLWQNGTEVNGDAEKYRRALEKHRGKILSDLEAANIVRSLVARRALLYEDMTQICAQVNNFCFTIT